MASARMLLVVVAAYWCAVMSVAMASDADNINDFCVADLTSKLLLNGLPCKDAATVTGEDFVFRGLEKTGDVSASPIGVVLTPAFAGLTFPALNTFGLAVARIDVAPYALIPPHTHPRATEVFYVVEGSFYVGFVDTTGKLFAANITKGDLFVLPKGLVHFELSTSKTLSTAIAVLNAQNPGTQFIASSFFGSHIPDKVLELAFGIDKATVKKIEKNFT
jgi:quercetin dioxygenase-like cupin family protein